MTPTIVILTLAILGQAEKPPSKPAASDNAVYQLLRDKGVSLGIAHISFPGPLLTEDLTIEAEQKALLSLTGDHRAAALAELTRNSISAPFILKLRDEKAGDKGIVRVVDLWFVIHAELDEVEPAKAAAASQTIEAGNMRFTSARLDESPLRSNGIPPPKDNQAWHVRMTGRLLDRIQLEATDQVVVSRTPSSWLIASRTDPRFDSSQDSPNRWYPLLRKGTSEEAGKPEPYPGGASYVKIARLTSVSGALLVEGHFAFYEPKSWFDGAPILRSKIGVVAQDRIRELRRDLAKSHKAKPQPSTPGTESR